MPRLRPTTLQAQHRLVGALWHEWLRPEGSAGRYGFVHGLGHSLVAGDPESVRSGLTHMPYFVVLWQRPHERWRLYLYWRWLDEPDRMVAAYTHSLPPTLGTGAVDQVDAVGQWLAVVGFLDSFGLNDAAHEQLSRCVALAESTPLVDEARLAILNQQGVAAQRRGDLVGAARHLETALEVRPAAARGVRLRV